MASTLGGGLWVVTSIALYSKIHLWRKRLVFNYMFTHRVLLCNEHSGQMSPGCSAQLGVCFQQFSRHIPLTWAGVPSTSTRREGPTPQPSLVGQRRAILSCALGQTLHAFLSGCFNVKSVGIMGTVLESGLSRAELTAELRVVTKHISAETAHEIKSWKILFFTQLPFFSLYCTQKT